MLARMHKTLGLILRSTDTKPGGACLCPQRLEGGGYHPFCRGLDFGGGLEFDFRMEQDSVSFRGS